MHLFFFLLTKLTTVTPLLSVGMSEVWGWMLEKELDQP